MLHEVREGGFLPRRVAASLPPGTSKQKDVRYLDIHEDDQLDEAQLAAWVKQAAACPANACEREVARCVRGLSRAGTPELTAPRGAEDLLGGGEFLAAETDEVVRVVGRDGDVARVRGGHDQPAVACPETEMHLGADLRGAGERLLPQARRRRRVEPGRGLAPLHGRLVAAAASLALAYWSTETVTFFFPSALTKTTDLDAIGLPTLVSFGPVLASLVISGKYLVTTLTGTTVSRGSKDADGAAASPHAANERSAIAATESTTARAPRCRFIFASHP